MNQKLKNILKVISVLLCIYIVLYVVASIFGGYWPTPVIDKTRYAESGIGVPTSYLWQPRFIYSDNSSSTASGVLFKPMICIDRCWFHTNLDLVEDESLIFSGKVKWYKPYNDSPTRKTTAP